MEIWKEIQGFSGYLVSNYGNVFSQKSGKNLSLVKDSNGYIFAPLRDSNSKQRNKMVHRLVANAFIKKPFESDDFRKLQTNHINGIKTENHVKNLEWMTPKEQQRHSRTVLKNRCAIGELSGSAKLTEKKVIEIREKIKNGKRGILTLLAKEYKVTLGNIHAIKVGRSWDCCLNKTSGG